MTGQYENSARSVEEIVFSLVADGRCEGLSVGDLARDYRAGLISVENARIFDAVVKASWEIRQSVSDVVSTASEKLLLSEEQEQGLVDAVISDDLARLSRDGLPMMSFRLRKAYDIALGGLASVVGGADRWAEFWPVVRSVLVTEARFLMEDEPVTVIIASKDGFTDVMSSRLVERLMTDPAGSEDFLRQLAEDLAVFLSKGNAFSGSWGEIAFQDGDLVFRLAAREKVVYEPSRARVLDISLEEE